MNALLRKVDFRHGLNAPREHFVANIARNIERKIDTFQTKRALLIAGGPSAADHLEDIRALHEQGWELFTVNGAHDWLVDQGIVPHYCAVMDSGSVVDGFIRQPQRATRYYLASQCHPSLFDRLIAGGFDVCMWHASLDAESNALIGRTDQEATILAPANTVSQHAAAILYFMGTRKLRVYGMDSSHRANSDHAYDNSRQGNVEEMEFVFQGKKYISTGTWAAQAEAFTRACLAYHRLGMRVEVIGDGLLPDMVRSAKEKLISSPNALPQTERK